MGFQDYIGESEACTFAGVSPSTLRRFAEAGYFQIETDSDGLRLFSKSEIENLFGLKPISGGRPKYTPQPTPLTPPPPTSAAPETTQQEPALTRSSTIVTNESGLRGEHLTASESARGPIRTASTVVRTPVEELPPNRESGPLPYTHAAPTPTATEIEPAPKGAAIEALEREVTKLQNILTLQEKLLDVREEEIRSIKGERDWLRSRIEKLEEKNERDQLLLLAETQTVRQLINLQQRKRSTVQLALEWLGLKSPQPSPGQPIEIASTPPRNGAPTEHP